MDYLKKRTCFSLAGKLLHPIISTTQIWVVTRHQYGISAPVFHTLFRGETTSGVAKWRLFSQAIERREREVPNEILSLFNLSSPSVDKREATHLYLDIIQSFLKCREDLGGKTASHSNGEFSAVCTQDVHRYRKVSRSRKCNPPTARVYRE